MPHIVLLTAALLAVSAHADDAAFRRDRDDILAVAAERARTAPDDAQQALKAGENRLRKLHEDYRLAKSTPPTTLDGDVGALSAAVARMRLERSRGRLPPADPRAARALTRLWDRYRADADALLDGLSYKRDAGGSPSSLYWDAVRAHEALAADILEAAARNPPPGETSAERAIERDRWELLKRLEDPDRLRGRLARIALPEHHPQAVFDIGPFYRAAGLVPAANPVRKGAFTVAPGTRTVTRREAGARLVVRAGRGRGVLVIGAEAKPLAYDYLIVPPDAPHIFENPSAEPLDVQFIGLAP